MPKTFQIAMAPEFTTKEMRDAVHGHSMGMHTKMDRKVLNKDLDELIETKVKRAERKKVVQACASVRTDYQSPR